MESFSKDFELFYFFYTILLDIHVEHRFRTDLLSDHICRKVRAANFIIEVTILFHRRNSAQEKWTFALIYFKVLLRLLALVSLSLAEAVEFIITTSEHITIGERIFACMLDWHKLWSSKGVFAHKLFAFISPE